MVTTKSALWVERNAFSETQNAVCIHLSSTTPLGQNACTSLCSKSAPRIKRHLGWKARELTTCTKALILQPRHCFIVAHSTTRSDWGRRISTCGTFLANRFGKFVSYRERSPSDCKNYQNIANMTEAPLPSTEKDF